MDKVPVPCLWGIISKLVVISNNNVFCIAVRASDKRIACDEDLSDSEDEGDGRKDDQNYKAKRVKTTNGDTKPGTDKPATPAAPVDTDKVKIEETAKPATEGEKPMDTTAKWVCKRLSKAWNKVLNKLQQHK